jgi:hypothetical protein
MISPSAVKLSYADSMLVSLRMFPDACSLSAIEVTVLVKGEASREPANSRCHDSAP